MPEQPLLPMDLHATHPTARRLGYERQIKHVHCLMFRNEKREAKT